MLGFIRHPKCPIDTFEKVWIEQAFRWLGKSFGSRRLLEALVIEPTAEYFPDPYDESNAAIEALFERVCKYLQVRRDRFKLELINDPDGDSGEYIRTRPERIVLNEINFHQPMQVVATSAHEVCHAILIGEDRLSTHFEDYEWLTDLTTVFLGMGIFAVNASTVYRRGRLRRDGYLSEREFAYALALFAWLRDEESPKWANQIRLNARHDFEASLNYLRESNDCLFGRSNYTSGNLEFDVWGEAALAAALHSPSPSRRLLAIWEMQKSAAEQEWPVSAIAPLLDDPDSSVRRASAYLLGAIGSDSTGVAGTLIEASARETDASTRLAIARALGGLPEPATEGAECLITLLNDGDEHVRRAAASSLISYAPILPETEAKQLLAFAQNDQDPSLTQIVMNVLAELPLEIIAQLTPDLLEILDDHDRPLHADALRVLTKLGPLAARLEPNIGPLLSRGYSSSLVAAAGALAMIYGDVEGAIAALRRARPLPIKKDRIRYKEFEIATTRAVRTVLGELGTSACEFLLGDLDHETLERQAFAVWGLGQIGPLPDQARERLQAQLHHREPLIRFLAASSLREIRGPDDPCVAVWLELLQDRPHSGFSAASSQQSFGHAAGKTLLSIGRPLVPAVLDCLGSDSSQSWMTLAQWLGEFAADSPDVITLLEREQATAVEPLASRIKWAFKQRDGYLEDRKRDQELRRFFPGPASPADDPPDPIDHAQEIMWLTLQYWEIHRSRSVRPSE
jgi:HEAT repeat protein